MTNNIGSKLKALRRSQRMTQQTVADRVGISRATISNYEIGRRTPHLKDLQRMAAFYGVGLDYFGITPTDEVLELLSRAKEVFESDIVSTEKKKELFDEIMKLYLHIK